MFYSAGLPRYINDWSPSILNQLLMKKANNIAGGENTERREKQKRETERQGK